MKKPRISVLILLLIILGLAGVFQFQSEPPPVNDIEVDSISIASFNIQILGRAKRSKSRVMEVLARVVREFDIVLIQEIRDSSESTMPIFLTYINDLNGSDYSFIRSERLGRSSSKEAYAYLYNTDTISYLEGTAHVWIDQGDVFEREPYIASFRSGNFDFTLVGIHTKPDDAGYEIGNLTIIMDHLRANQGDHDIIALGDFNADGSYYDEDDLSAPLRAPRYIWTVGNQVDTMTKTDWTYDRMVMFGTTYSMEYVMNSTGVFYFDEVYGLNQTLTWDISDHYPIYANFKVSIIDDD